MSGLFETDHVEVLGDKRMTALAVGLSGVLPGPAIAPQDVFLHRDGIKMVWPHASPHSAQMVDRHAFGDWPDVDFVRGTVNQNLSGFGPDYEVSGKTHFAVASGFSISFPNPMVTATIRPPD
jgi:hypothetical protein